MNTNHIRGPARAIGLLGIAVATCVLTATTFGVFAADMSDVPQVMVPASDLNLANAADAKKLYVRIHHAAEQVCERLDGRALNQQMKFNQCVRAATYDAVAQVDRPALTQYYDSRNPGRKTIQHVALATEK